MSRNQRLAALTDEYPGPHGRDGDLSPRDNEPRLKRYALVERNDGYAGGYWITTHDTPEGAAAYNAEQECAKDWWPLTLVDLDTGDEHVPERAFVVTFSEPRPADR